MQLGIWYRNIIDRAWKNIDRLIAKSQYDDPHNDDYNLVVTKAGYYPSFRGTGKMYLNVSDVWKYDQTAQQERYLPCVDIYLNLRQQTLATGSEYKVKAYEQILIVGYGMANGYLP